jgi:hypothetical protein
MKDNLIYKAILKRNVKFLALSPEQKKMGDQLSRTMFADRPTKFENVPAIHV